MGTTSTSGWAVFMFIIGFVFAGMGFIGMMLPSILGLAMIGYSVVLFQKAKVLEA